MKIYDAGHIYGLPTLDGNGEEIILTFVKRVGTAYPGNDSKHSGTITQEVLRAIIDRSKYVYNQEPNYQTEAVIKLLETAVWLLEMRTADRHGWDMSREPMNKIVYGDICSICLHSIYDSHGH